MKIIQITSEIWDEVRIWYKDACGLPLFLNDMGYVVEDGGQYIACSFLILTNSHFAIMEHLQVNPNVSKIKAGRAVIRLASFLGETAKGLGFKSILGLIDVENTSIRKMHKKCFGSFEVGKPQLVTLNIFEG